jgi:signal transduction histidine kinase
MAASGHEALERVKDCKPDIVLLDIMMPGIDGYEVCRRLRGDVRLKHLKIIMVSAKALTSERLEGYDAGADDYITKPFDEDELQAKVKVYSRLKSLEEVDSLKNNVLSLLSHESHTPLNAILSPAEMLMSTDSMQTEERMNLAQMIHRGATRLLALFDKILMLGAMRSGQWQLDLSTCHPGEVIDQAIDAVKEQTDDGRNIIVQIVDDPQITFDRLQITRTCATLLDNALKFSSPDQPVEITCFIDGDRLKIAVTDHGKGIDHAQIAHVFSEFGASDVNHHTNGHGLSLALAQETVALHGGDVHVESQPDKGATFTITLPLTHVSRDQFPAGSYPESAA